VCTKGTGLVPDDSQPLSWLISFLCSYTIFQILCQPLATIRQCPRLYFLTGVGVGSDESQVCWAVRRTRTRSGWAYLRYQAKLA
jgi:hypothetical protein